MDASGLMPLAGVRVLELGSDVSLAFATRLLADMGAEVLRPEPTEDCLRGAPPLLADGESALFIYLNAGKHLAPAGVVPISEAGLVLALAGHPNLPARDDRARPPVVVLSPHGLSGLRAGAPGNAFTTQHGGGYAWHQASPVSDTETAPPLGCPDREAAMLVGLIAANAAMAALAEPDDEIAPWVDLSAEDIFAWMLVDALAEYHDGVLVPGRKRQPGREITIAGGLIWLLPCADGTIVVSPREDHQWARWVALMGDPEWARDGELCGTRAARTRNAAELGRLMRLWSAGVAARPIFEQAQAARVACFPVSTAPDLLANRQLAARAFFRELALADAALPMPGLPFAMRDGAGARLARGAAVARPAKAAGFETPARRVALGGAMPHRPLAGIRIVDFSWVVAGPMATKMLGALGAEVIKIESSQRPEFAMRDGWFAVVNNNKRSTTIDITTAQGQALIRDLVAQSDVVVENFSSRVLTKNGLSYSDLAAVKPDLIYVSASGLGREGPERDLLAYGSLLQCYSGRVGLIGRANPQLEAMGVMPAWTDPVTSLWESLAILAALRHRAATRRGMHIDLSMLEATVALLPDALLHAGLGRTVPRNGCSEDLSGAYSGIFRCAGDDAWLALSVTTEAEWQGLCAAVALAPSALRAKPQGDALAAWCRERDAATAEAMLRAHGVPASASRGIFDLVNDAHLKARGLFRQVEGGAWSIALPWMHASGDRGALAQMPGLGADNDYVFGHLLGLDSSSRQALVEVGVIR